MDAPTIIDMIYASLMANADERIKGISIDGDNDSAEIILVTEEDGHKEWVISSSSVRLLEDD